MVGWLQRAFKLVDLLFPAELALSNASGFRRHKIELTTLQVKISIWLALFSYAFWGIWDVFGEGSGINSTRYRFLVACPVFAAFGIMTRLQFVKRYQEAFILIFSFIGITILFFHTLIIDHELPFKISTGTATINFYLVIFFGYALLPFLVLDGLLFGAMCLVAHTVLILFYSDLQFLMASFYINHTAQAVSLGMFVAYWREWFMRTEFHDKTIISSNAKINSLALANSKIVISYRRTDSEGIAGRIRDRLANFFGEKSIFMDVDSIPLGIDFRDYIETILTKNDMMIVIIGPSWLGTDTSGVSRINDESDPVRMEVELAFERGVPIIPVLVGGARMPSPTQLPQSLKKLAFRNAAEVHAGRDFHHHLDGLIQSLLETTAVGQQNSSIARPIQ
jgi:hypothetical protein